MNTLQLKTTPLSYTQTHSSISVSICNLFCFDLAIELCNDCKFVMLRLSPTEVWELSPPLSLFDSSKYFNCPQDKDQIRNPTHTSHAQIFCISHQQRFARSDFFLPNATRCLAKLPAPCTMEASAWGTEQIISFHLIFKGNLCVCLNSSTAAENVVNLFLTTHVKHQADKQTILKMSFCLLFYQEQTYLSPRHQNNKTINNLEHVCTFWWQNVNWSIYDRLSPWKQEVTWLNLDFSSINVLWQRHATFERCQNQDETNHALNTWTFVLVVKICTTAYSMSIHQTVHTVHIQTVPQTKHIYSSKPSFVCLSCLLEINFYWWAE